MTEKELGAMQVVNKYVLFSAAAGLVPLPLFDIAAVTGVQVLMLSDLAKHYSLPFSADRGKAVLSALIGGVLPTQLAQSGIGMTIKRIPVIGPILGVFTVSAFASASTYAVARVFIQHFESGGTFLDFDPDEVRKHFKEEFDKAKAAASVSGAMPSVA